MLHRLLTVAVFFGSCCGFARAEQFVLFDATFTYTKEDAENSKPSKSHYYVREPLLNANRPKDWTAPVDYRNGTIHIRTEVIEKPAGGEPTTWSICYIPNKGQKNGYGCTGTVVYKEKGVYEQDVSMTAFWQNDSIVWPDGVKQIDLVMKDGSGGSGHAHKRADFEKFFPTKVRITVVQVSAGAKYDASLVPKLPAKDATKADTVFRHGEVYTVDARRSWAEAVAVRDGRIAYVGSDAGVAPWIGPQTRVIDLNDKILLPGFHDSHVHLVGGGIELGECDLNGTTSLEQVLTRVRQFAEQHPEKTWIRGGGWPLTMEGGNPNKTLLDAIVPDRPVILDAFDGHSSWVNSRALAIAGVTRDTPDPPRGRIERDPKTGDPTGTLRELAARLVLTKTPQYSHDDYVTGLRRGLEMANRFGITSVQEASAHEQHLDAYADLDRSAELSVKAVAAMRVDPTKGMTQVPQFVEWRSKYASKRLRATAVKIFEDGVIESHTAALLEPYIGGNERGWLNFEPDVLNPLATELDRLGFQIHIHAIGDRAIQASFDALEFARARNGVRDSRHHIAHIQLFDPVDIPRFQRLGVIANFQPLWAYADPYIIDMTLPVLGPQRSRWLYPIRSVAITGAMIACGSDWSVSSMNPLDAIQVAVTRRGPEEGPGAAWIPDEVVDLPTMLAGYTINGARVNFQESETGSIEVGKAADFIVLDRNLFTIPAHEIHSARVLLTMLDGKDVYRDPGFSK